MPDQFGLHSAGSAGGVTETLAASFRFLAIASTMGAALSEADIRKTTEIVRRLSEDVKARSRTNTTEPHSVLRSAKKDDLALGA